MLFILGDLWQEYSWTKVNKVQMGQNLFVYGTLMNTELLEPLSGIKPVFKPAMLTGYRRVAVRNAVYPAIYPAEGWVTDGQLLEDLTGRQLACLDAFEGDCYCRCAVNVRVCGQLRHCDAYVIRPEFNHLLTDQCWHNEDFRRDHLAMYSNRLFGGE